MIQTMARMNYSAEFRRQAVDLYESTPGATVRGIAEDLGVERGTLRHCLRRERAAGQRAVGSGLPAGPELVEPVRPPALAHSGRPQARIPLWLAAFVRPGPVS